MLRSVHGMSNTDWIFEMLTDANNLINSMFPIILPLAIMLAIRLLIEIVKQIRNVFSGDDIPGWEMRNRLEGGDGSIIESWDEEPEEDDEEVIEDEDLDVLFCSYCGSPNELTSLKCDSCGAPLRERRKVTA